MGGCTKDQIREYKKKYYKNNKEILKLKRDSRSIEEKEEHKKYNREYILLNKENLKEKYYKKRNENNRLILQYKETHPCEMCGQSNPDYLDFHHIDKTNKRSIGQLKNCSWERIKVEIDKCIVLCVYCHRKEHSYSIKKAPIIDNKYTRRYKRNNEYLKQYKIEHHCEICGQSNPLYLDFHHRNPNEKDSDISELIRGGSLSKIRKEINKCIVLCAYCHRDVHKLL